MSVNTISGVRWRFWTIGAAALIWNVMGAMNFIMQMNIESLASYPEAARNLIEGRIAAAMGA